MSASTDFHPNTREYLGDIIAYVTSEPFFAVLREFDKVPREERHNFIRRVLINREEMARRGAPVPPDLVIQRSAFEDRRPTLFAVVKHLPDHRKVTVTFDEGWQALMLDHEFGEEQLLGTPT